MAKRRMKLTGFARFLIVMVFAAPLAYIAASYYNGEDGIENFKRLIGIDGKEKTEIVAPPPAATATENAPAANSATAEEETSDSSDTAPARDLRQENLKLREENINLREQLQQRDKEILELKHQLQKLQAEKEGN